MDHPLIDLIDRIVEDAQKRGDFDNLPGAGAPLPHLDDPANAVLARMMKEADATSPIVTLRNQITASQARLDGLTDPEARKAEMRTLSDLQTKLGIEIEAFRKYG